MFYPGEEEQVELNSKHTGVLNHRFKPPKQTKTF